MRNPRVAQTVSSWGYTYGDWRESPDRRGNRVLEGIRPKRECGGMVFSPPVRDDSTKCDLMVSFDDIDFFRHLIRSRPERRIAKGAITYDKPTRYINSHRMQRRRVSVHAD